jgi:hypothetical protein
LAVARHCCQNITAADCHWQSEADGYSAQRQWWLPLLLLLLLPLLLPLLLQLLLLPHHHLPVGDLLGPVSKEQLCSCSKSGNVSQLLSIELTSSLQEITVR